MPSKNLKYSVANYMSSHVENGIDLEWKDITYKTTEGKTILNGLCGTSFSGELTAIMGPSGSGKTSLVNILSGFNQKGVTGEILVNGTKRDLDIFRKLTSYVLQDDHVLPLFTVRELITFASKLKMPSTVTKKERQKAIDDCIYGLGLTGQKDQKANTLSGGQKKRLCIGQEIVNNPPLIFLDEPTSGLDSASCLQCIMLLKTMAEKGKNIICTIHQPSSRIFEIFDNLYMISEGNCIYKGSTKDLLPYLAEQGLNFPKYHSPTDILTDIAIGLYGEEVRKLKDTVKSMDESRARWPEIDVDDLSKNEEKSRVTSMMCSITDRIKEISQDNWHHVKKSQYAASNFNQFRVLLSRYFIQYSKDPMIIKLKFFGNIVMGLLLGSLFYNTGNDNTKILRTTTLLFTYIIFLMVTAVIPTVLTFPLQRTIFERERRNGWYSTKMYFLATTLIEIPYQMLCSTISSALLYWLSDQPMETSRICLFILSSVLVALIAESLGLVIGAMTNIQNGVAISCFLTCTSLALTGYFLLLRETPAYLRWICQCSFTRHGFESFLLNIYLYRPDFKCKGLCLFREPE